MHKMTAFGLTILIILVSATWSLAQINMELSGALQIAEDTTATPLAGTIRYQNARFEGFNGNEWLPLNAPTTSLNCNVGLPVPLMLNSITIKGSMDTVSSRFGRSVAIEGDVAVIGAPGNQMGGNVSGAAYIFKYNNTTWTEIQKLTIATAGPGFEGFGESVGISQNHIAVSAPGYDNGSGPGIGPGAVFIYQYNDITMSYEAMDTVIQPDPAASVATFGTSIAISGDHLVIGDFLADVPGFLDRGRAYVYKNRAGDWQYQAELLPSVSTGHAFFGIDVDIEGDYIIVGAERLEQDALQKGHAFVYFNNNDVWQLMSAIESPYQSSSDHKFGKGVTISGDRVAIAAEGKDSVAIYNRTLDAWNLEKIIASEDGSNGFGKSIDMNGDYLIIGHNSFNPSPTFGVGKVYIYQYKESDWILSDTFQEPFPEERAEFGIAVATDMMHMIIGAFGGNTNGYEQAGRALISSVDPN